MSELISSVAILRSRSATKLDRGHSRGKRSERASGRVLNRPGSWTRGRRGELRRLQPLGIPSPQAWRDPNPFGRFVRSLNVWVGVVLGDGDEDLVKVGALDGHGLVVAQVRVGASDAVKHVEAGSVLNPRDVHEPTVQRAAVMRKRSDS